MVMAQLGFSRYRWHGSQASVRVNFGLSRSTDGVGLWVESTCGRGLRDEIGDINSK